MSDLPTSPGGRALELLKVAELRDELRKRGLGLKGAKKELFERLEEAIKKEDQEGIVYGEHAATQGDAHKTSKSDGTEDFEEEEEALDEAKDKASDMTSSCPSDKLLSDVVPPTPLSTIDEATPISEKHALSGVSAPDGVPGFNDDSAASAASVGTNNDVLFVDNAVSENGDAMPLLEKIPSVADMLEPGKEVSGNHETRSEIATPDLKASGDVDVSPESGIGLSVNENIVSDVINASIENDNAHATVDIAVSVNDASVTDCAVQVVEKTNLAAGPEVVADQISKLETVIEVSPSEIEYKCLMQPTLYPGLPVEENDVADLKTETLSAASQNVFEPLADSRYEETEKRIAGERRMILDEDKPDTKMQPVETGAGLKEKNGVGDAGGVEKSHVKMEPMEVDASPEDKQKVISEGNKEMHIDEDSSYSQLKRPSKEVKLEKSSCDYAGESRGGRVPAECNSNVRDNTDSEACIHVKRKDTDTKQQEPATAKRMRRWNSGKEVKIDALKPLTTDIVKEMILPENTEGSFVAARRLTPKAVATSREVPPKVKVEPDNGNTQTAPPSTRAPSNSLKIERFVRPFTLKAVKDLLGEFGKCVDFWMDQIKTHCFVTYSSVNEAVAARSGLYGRRWPPSVGNFLVAEFVDANEVKIRSEETTEKAQGAQSTAPLWNANTSPTPTPRVALSAPSFRGRSNTLPRLNTLPPSRFSRETQLPAVPKKDAEPAGLTLEDLFFKTKAKPSIYYLPLTDEQVAEKLTAAKNEQTTR